MADTMQAVMLEAFGLQVTVATVPRPKPTGSQVLVQVESTPINPSDLLYLQGHYASQQELPAVTGKEGAGIIVETGAEATALLGKRVAIVKPGTWAQYLLAEAHECIPLQDNIDLDQAACLFINPVTALMFREVLRQAGSRAFVQTAANSALGKMMIRLARMEGMEVVNVVRSESSAEKIRQEGAQNVLVSTDSDFPAQLQSTCSRLNANIAFDAVGGDLTGQLLSGLVAGGVVYVYGLLGQQPVQGVLNMDVILGKKRLAGLWLPLWLQKQSAETRSRLVSEAQTMLHDVLRTEIAQHYTLDQVQTAISAYASNMSAGKALIHPNR